MSSTTTRKDQAHESAERAKEAAASAGDKMKEAASHAGQAVSSAASAAGTAIGNAASAVGEKADEASAAVGRGMEWLGDKVRDKGPESGIMGRATDAVASGLESAGKYLEDRNLSGMAEDVGAVIRRHPFPAVLIGVGVGFLLGRILSSRS